MRRLMTSKLACVTVAGALAVVGCTNDLAKEGTADVFMRIVAIVGTEGPVVVSDVGAATAPTFASVTLAARSKNPVNNDTNYARAIQLERFEVRYYRSDGRNVEGVDVPFAFAGDIRLALDIGDPDKNLTTLIEVVRPAAKLEPPLLNLRNGGAAAVLTIQAEITIYGRTLASNDIIQTSGSVPVEFRFTPTNQLP